jgi:BlaI family penicillinase repressor
MGAASVRPITSDLTFPFTGVIIRTDYKRKWNAAMSISEAESQVMEVLWERHPLNAEEVVTALSKTTDWQEPTVKTLLNRLLKKHAIAAERDGRRYLYRPVLTRAEYVHSESKGLLDRLFHGRIAPLVALFSERRRLSKKDIAELKRLIAEIDHDQ